VARGTRVPLLIFGLVVGAYKWSTPELLDLLLPGRGSWETNRAPSSKPQATSDKLDKKEL